ncbi:MAG TPA: S-adenosylmethionine:tRNA ribosyltransferase-isomerase [Actinophytocola sp.]|uniref:S-adenosylmethionine:tRNA ribosyltransferase-isomerase n=1 Tax=Actinophytocola sp. TaxID=1872138 RepID=UPI002DDD3867|nr:S-adenosylmethionine:tRNA ribosyltransferase-isomerase [Actinophytocola sp.]HEV2782130.1 S-adenosylmethionine:tRNA ribosyltransferase-isomerase [Actinophytocola sp.]
MTALEFTLPAELEAHEPPEARGLSRDRVRLLVGHRSSDTVRHHRFTDLPGLLAPGDVLVVNTSATLPAAVGVTGGELTVHFSTEQPDGSWLVEPRRNTAKATEPFGDAAAGDSYPLVGGATVTLREPYSAGRLWIATLDTAVRPYLDAFGAPIRYSYVHRRWPLSYYRTVFGTTPGSAEMPSASRPFTDRMVSRLVSAGIQFAPVLLHTGVASPEAHERPYPEPFAVSAHSARVVNQARAAGGRIIAIGTTAVRALETAAGADGLVHPANGWTDLIVTPGRGVRVTDGLLTGFHEAQASHVDMLTTIAGPRLLDHTYTEAISAGYLWHEFGDVNLILP